MLGEGGAAKETLNQILADLSSHGTPAATVQPTVGSAIQTAAPTNLVQALLEDVMKAPKTAVSSIDSLFNPSAMGTNITGNIAERNIPVDALNNIRKSLGATTNFQGAATTGEQAAKQAAYFTIRDAMTGAAPEANLPLKLQSVLYNLKNSLGALPKGLPLGLGGETGTIPTTLKIADILGGSHLLPAAAAATQGPNVEQPAQTPISTQETTPTTSLASATGTGAAAPADTFQSMLPLLMLQEVSRGNYKGASALKLVGDLMNTQSKANGKTDKSYQAAVGIMDSLRGNPLNQVGTPQAMYTKLATEHPLLAGTLGQSSQNLVNLHSTFEQLRNTVVPFLEGRRGGTYYVKAANAYIPLVTDSRPTIITKLHRLQDLLQSVSTQPAADQSSSLNSALSSFGTTQ